MEYTQILTDAERNLSIKEWKLSSEDVGDRSTGARWSVTKRTLAGGRQEGVDVIEVDNGVMQFSVVPTRGCNIWSANVGELRLGWDSPVREIVHPQFVSLGDRGGLGWLDGFGEWVSRCGLEWFGAPGPDGNRILTLHGRISYLPASFVEVRFVPEPGPRLVVRGVVNEAAMFGPQLRLTTEISVEIGKPVVVLDDLVTNLADAPQEMQSLYHINFGPPLLSAGAEFVAAVKRVAPRDSRAAEGDMADWDTYAGPQSPGYTEQVYLMELFADDNGMTETMLKVPDGTKAAVVSFNIRELPYMTLWKNEAPARSGYVTGLEPGTSYPNPRGIERASGRVPLLNGGESHRAKVTISALVSKLEVEDAVSRIKSLQRTLAEIVTASFL
jgi:hypothetical protein